MTPLRTSPAAPPMPNVARDQPDPGADALARELVADDPERQREDRPGDALDGATGDEHLDRVRQRADERADAEGAEHVDEHALLAEHVAEAADDRRGDRGAEQVDGEHPGDRRRRRAQGRAGCRAARGRPSSATARRRGRRW